MSQGSEAFKAFKAFKACDRRTEGRGGIISLIYLWSECDRHAHEQTNE